MKTLLALVGAGLLAGCASQKTLITRTTDGPDSRTTEITRVATRTFFDSKSKLANFAALNATATNTTQRVDIGSLSQESSSVGVVQSLEILLKMLKEMKGAPTPMGSTPPAGP